MNRLELHLPLEQANADMTRALDVKDQTTALRQHHRERLARLFRHASHSADDGYLRDIMARYRELDPS